VSEDLGCCEVGVDIGNCRGGTGEKRLGSLRVSPFQGYRKFVVSAPRALPLADLFWPLRGEKTTDDTDDTSKRSSSVLFVLSVVSSGVCQLLFGCGQYPALGKEKFELVLTSRVYLV
jgi:hypothetical protein